MKLLKKTKSGIFFFGLILLCVLISAMQGIVKADTGDEPVEIDIETTVTAPVEEFMVTTSVLNRKEIERSPARDASDLLQNQNGVISLGTSNKKGKAELGIRGFGINYIRVYLDGVPLNTANDRTVDLSLIPVEIIERIEVIKGPAPVTYGSDSMGGIINIVTRSGKDAKGVKASFTGGGYGLLETSFTAGGGKGPLGVFIMGKSRKHDGYRPHTAENFTDLFLKADYEINKNNRASLFIFNTTGKRDGPDGQNPDGSLRLQTSGFMTGSRQWEYFDIIQRGINFRLESADKEKIGYRADIFYKKYDDVLRAYVDPAYPVKPPAGSPFAYYRAGDWNYSYWNSHVYGGDFRISAPLANHLVTVGTGFERSFFKDTYMGRSVFGDPAGSMGLPKDQWTRDYMNPWTDLQYWSIYAEDKIRLDRFLTLTLGVRSDSCSRSNASFNGIANLVYSKDSDTWRATVGKTGRFPTLKELDGKGGNPDLVAESAFNYEIGYRHREPNFVDIEGAVAYSSISNLIQPKDPDDGFSLKENISRVKIMTMEAAVSRQWKNLWGRFGYTYVHRVSPPLTSDWEEVPRHKAVAELRWEKEKNICFGLQGIFLSNKQTGDPDIPTIPGYGIINASVAYPSFGDKNNDKSPWNLELKVNNLLDKKYQNRLYYPAPGRWVTGSFRYRF